MTLYVNKNTSLPKLIIYISVDRLNINEVDPQKNTNEVILFYLNESPLYKTNLAVGIEILSNSVIVLYAIHANFIYIYIYMLKLFQLQHIDDVHSI